MPKKDHEPSRRSDIEIIESVLDFIYREGEVKKTRIMYAANLNTKSLNKLLDRLMNIGAIVKVKLNPNSRNSMYILTPRGRSILILIKRLRYTLSRERRTTIHTIDRILHMLQDFVQSSRIKVRKNYEIEGTLGVSYSFEYVVVYEGQTISLEIIDQDINANDIPILIGEIIIKTVDSRLSGSILLVPQRIHSLVSSILNNISLERARIIAIPYTTLSDEECRIIAYRIAQELEHSETTH